MHFIATSQENMELGPKLYLLVEILGTHCAAKTLLATQASKHCKKAGPVLVECVVYQ